MQWSRRFLIAAVAGVIGLRNDGSIVAMQLRRRN
jgi:hypothetical protein